MHTLPEKQRKYQRTQPCFTPLWILNGSEVDSSKTTVPCIFSWKDLTMLRSLGGNPILNRILKMLFLLTRSKAFDRSMKATNNGWCFFVYFSWSWCRENTCWYGSHTVIWGRFCLQVSEAVLTRHDQIAFRLCWGERYCDSCYSHFCSLCFCTA